MKVVELHPEDLFDKADRGQLSGEEQLLLDAHLRACPACRFERAVRFDFEQQLGDDALDGVPSLVAGALGALPKAPPAPPPAPPPVPALKRSWLRRPVVLLAAAALLIAGGAAAQSGVASGLWKKSTEHLSGILAPSPRVQASVVIPPGAHHAPAPREVPSAAPTEDAAPGIAPATSAEPAAKAEASAAPSTPVVLASPRAPVVPGKVTAVPAPVPRTETAPAPVDDRVEAPSEESPASLFERANAARRRGSVSEAARLYGELQARHPRSAEARLAVVLLARAQLDQGNARAALAGFDAYLGAGGGSLREEAMAGRAMALGRLGRAAEETRAWEALLAAFPRSSYASLAARRLGSTER